jgi:urease accessory protein
MLSDILIVASMGRTPRIECAGGVAARRTEADTVHLVSAAATPLGGDTIRVRVVVEPGAVLRLRSAAATMAMPGTVTMESRATWDLEVAGHLDLDPQPTIVAGQARHVTSTRLTVSGAGTVRLRERVQIGRSNESEGFWSGSVHADVDGRPLIRHRVELGSGSATHDALGTPMACVSELRYPETDFDTAGTLLELAAGGCLATWQGERLVT